MATTLEIIAYALGSGLGEATIFFPIAYFAVRKQFHLRDNLGQAWRPFFLSFAAFALIQVLGIQPAADTFAGLTATFLMPIVICAVILHFTYRAPLGNYNE